MNYCLLNMELTYVESGDGGVKALSDFDDGFLDGRWACEHLGGDGQSRKNG